MRSSRLRIAVSFLLVALALASAACDRGPAPGEIEETAMTREQVPVEILDAAGEIAGRIGAGGCEDWFWDREDRVWECTYVGLSRPAELDIETDGRFSELELVYSLAEVEASLPDRAAFIRERCREDPDVLIELSLRSENHLNPIPDLATAWTRSEVVLEFQCPNGVDYEVDALSQGVYRRADDKRDVSTHE